MLATGGLYGIYLFLGLNEYEIDVDQILPENTNHAMIGLAVYIPMGIARGIGQVSDEDIEECFLVYLKVD